MTSFQKHRSRHPDVSFQTRPLSCADGITRLLTLEPWYWQRLDGLLKVDTQTLDQITGFCIDLANQAVEQEGWEFDEAFRELLMYYIYRNYFGYVQVRDGLANDTWEDCFKHQRSS